MKACEVLKLLKVSQPTLGKYVKEGYIKCEILPTGRRVYDEESVYSFLNKNVPRQNYIYARVSTYSQKNSLDNQVDSLLSYCMVTGIKVTGVFKDIASGISFENRKEFFKLLDDVIDHKVAKVVITYKDRLSRVGFGLFYHLFKKFGTEIIVMSEVGSPKLDSQEIFEEVVSLLHCYSMKMYSKRRIAKIKEALEDDETNSESVQNQNISDEISDQSN